MPTIVQTFQGRVTGLWGTASMRGTDGKMHVLKVGDVVHKGDVILTSQDGIVQLSADEVATASVTAAATPASASPDVDRVISGLNDRDSADATAAGVAGGDGAGDLTPGLRVERIAEAVTPAGLAQPGDAGNLRLEPRGGGAIVATEQQPRPPIDADSNTIHATEEGPSVGLGLTAPTGVTSAAVITVTQLPLIGTLLKADGTPVMLGSVLTTAELTGLQYLPPADYNGTAPIGGFGYTVSDQGVTVGGGVVIELGTVNDTPVGNADSATTPEDTPVTGNVLTNDRDVDGDTLTVTQYTIAGVSHAAGSSTTILGIGTVVLNGNGSYTFTPAADYHGPVPPIGYTLSDGTVTTTSTLTITVTSVNDAPDAADDIASTPINVPVTVAVLANDRDRDGDPLTVTGATLADPTRGTLVVNPDGSVSFTPANNYAGPVVITYTVSDGHGGTDTATVTVNVGNNTPPTGADSVHAIAEDGSYTVQVADFGFADADAGQTLANVRIDALPAAGTLLLNGSAVAPGTVVSAADIAAGKLVFVPAADGNGAPYANFRFTVQDSAGAFDTAPNTLTLNVTPVNDAPVAVADTGRAPEDTPVTGNVLANDRDVDGDALHVSQFVIGGSTYAAGSIATLAGIGTLVIQADGSYTFTPVANYNGPVPVATYTATDGTLTSTATLTISVTPVNDPPVAADDLASTPINTPVVIGVLGNDGDVDGDTLTVTTAVLANPAQGTVTINPNGTLNFTPATNVTGSVVITYTVADGHGGTDTASVTVNVGNNTPPLGADSTHTIAEDTSYTVQAADLGFSDADAGQTLANVRIDTLPAAGSLLLNGIAVAAGAVVSAADIAAGKLVFVPVHDANSTPYANFTFSVQDSAGAYDATPNTLTLNVTPVNDVPVAVADTVNAIEDQPFIGTVAANDTPSADGGNLFSLVAGSGPAHGTIVFNGDGTFTYTPAANYHGADSFSYALTDIDGSVSTAVVSINVASVNDVPVAVADTVAAVEDTPLVGSVAGNDTASGDGGNVFALVAGNGPNHGGIVFNADGTFTYTPNANYHGADTFTYSLTDGDGDTSTATVTINVASVNDVPVAVADTVAAVEDTPLVGSVAGNDTLSGDGGNVFALVAGSGPAHGGIVFNADGTFTYTPSANYNGPDTFTYSLTDADGSTSTATVTINVASVNDVPVAVADTVAAVEDTPLVGSVAGNDTLSGDGGNVFALVAGSGPAHGGIVFNADGTFTYTPSANYNGPDTFMYSLTDADGSTSTATVTINVASVNDVPVAVADTVAAVEDTPLVGSVAGNDTASGDGGNVFALVAGSGPAHGGIVFNADGTFTYTPSANYNGPDTFSYSLTDGDGDTSIATVTINVASVNDVPVAVADTVAAVEDTPLVGSVAGNDTLSGDGGNVFALVVGSGPAHGGIVFNADGTFTYTPGANYNGPDTFTYSLTDADGSTSTATVTINVASVNDVPVAVADTVAAVEDTPLVGSVAGNDTLSGDGGNVFALVVGSGPAHGGIVFNADGTFTYTPSANYNGPDTFTYSLTDADGSTSTATVTINVASVNDVPVAVADTVAAVEDTPLVGSVAGNDTLSGDGGNVFALVAGSGPAHGGIVFNADGTFTYTPSANYNGPDTFSYSLTDADGDISTATVTINVAPVNDLPVAVNDTVAATEDTPFVGSVAGNDTPSGDGGNVFALVTGSGPAHGAIVFNADGTFTYTPAANYNGADTFSYSLTDANGDVSTAIVSISVAPVNDVPTPLADTQTTPEDTQLVVNAANGVLANDSDADSAVLTVTQFSVAGMPGSFAAGATAAITGVGALTINGDGSYSFTPAADYNGPVPVATYTVSDGALTSTSTLTLTVTPVNDPPTLSLDANQSHNTVAVQAIVGLFNTGESNAGTALPLGTIDPHYTVVSAPVGSTLTASATGLPGSWVANDADSTWIGSTGNQPTGVYQYQTSFTLQAGADPASVNISFDLSSDNNLRDILVNGVSTGFSSNLQYSQFTHVDLHGVTAAFTTGVNTITFVVDNRDPGSPGASGPTGLRIDNMSGNVAVIVPDSANHIGDFATVYVEGTPVSIADTDTAVRDIDSPTMQSATITLTNAQLGDLLQVGALPPGIVASVNAAGTIVTLTGAASQASYEAAIRAVQFNNTSDTPPASIDRLVTVVVNDGFLNSNTATTTIHVVPVNDAPTLDLDGNNSTAPGTAYATTYIENAAAIRIVDADVTIQDVDSTNLRSATVHIINVQPGDVLAVGALPAGISAAVYDPASGILTLSGNATLAAYQTALRAIGFSNSSNSPSAVTRDIEISVNDGAANSNVAVSHINVVPVNDAPAGTDRALTIDEDTAYVLHTADFGFTDTLDNPANAFASVTVNPTSAGTLTLNGVVITAPTSVTVAQLNGDLLRFSPVANANGTAYATLKFQVKDDGGTANGGVDTDQSPNTLTFNVTPVNDAPIATGSSALAAVAEDTLSPAGASVSSLFLPNFSDLADAGNPSQNQFAGVAVRGQSVAAAEGRWQYSIDGGANWQQFAAISDTNAIALRPTDLVRFLPAADFNGTPANLSVRLIDNTATVTGGAAINVFTRGGSTPYSSNIVTVSTSVLSVNDAPAGADKTVTTPEDTAYTLARSDFGFVDAKDAPANTFASVVVGPTSAGSLTLGGVAVTASTVVTVAQLDAGLLKFTPAQDANGNAYATLRFQVRDDGGTANGGVDTDLSPNTITFNVTPVNDPAVIGGLTTGATVEDVTLNAAGTLTVTDPDAGQAAFIAQANVAGAHGTFNLDAAGHWTYALNNADPAVQALAQGQTLPNELFTVRSIDGTATTVTVTITGTNDAPIAVDDIVITNVAAGQGIAIASGALARNDTDVDNNTVLAVSNSFNAVNGVVAGTSPVVFRDTASFGANAQRQAEDPLFPGDSETSPRNNTIATAYEVERGRFGQVSAADAPYVTDPTLASFKWTGRIDDTTGTPNATDRDFIKVYLHAGEKIILDIDGADSGRTDIGTDTNAVDTLLQFYSASGALLAENDDALPTMGGLGSVKSGYHNNSLDSYLEYTVAADGYYYVNVTAFNNNASGIAQDDGNYQLWMSIRPSATPHPTSFDYTVSDGIVTDDGHVTVTTVQGSALNGTAASQILIGGGGNDTVNGGGGNDWIQGGGGSDSLTGGSGSDVFAWVLADRGPGGVPPTDTITNFSVAAPSAGGDVLDLRDLLQGEAKAGTNPGNLQNYLDFDTTSAPGSTIVHVSSTGGFAGGVYNAAAEDQRIVLQGVDVRSPGAFGLPISASDNDVIQQLLQRGKLVTDGP